MQSSRPHFFQKRDTIVVRVTCGARKALAKKQCLPSGNMARKQSFLVCPPSGNMVKKQGFFVSPPLGNMARKQWFLVCPPLGNMVKNQCFLVSPTLGNMARKQCFLVCPPSANMVKKQCLRSWFVHLRVRETWLGNSLTVPLNNGDFSINRS